MEENKKNDLKAKKRPLRLIFCKYNIFVWLVLIIWHFLKPKSLLYAPGSHIITAYPGGGKTLLMSHIINSVDSSKYFFLSNMNEFEGHENVYRFDIEEMFQNNEQVKSFPVRDLKGRYLYGIIFDEINLTFNKRLNRKSTYNDLFIGLIEFLVSHRHQGINRVYFIGQKLELQDTQLQSLFKYQHDILKCRKFPKYPPFNRSGKLIFYPWRLKIMHRIKTEGDIFGDYKKQRVRIKTRDYEMYDTRFLGHTYANKPKAEEPYKQMH